MIPSNIEAKPEKPRASTTDILGNRKNGRINPVWRQHYLRLLDLRDALTARQSRLVEEAKDQLPTFSEHMGEAGTDQYDQDFALSMLSSDQSALYEIDEALNRIRDGSYGVCELSGKPIEPERLMAIPWTRFSLYAQQILERRGEGNRTQFAPRRGITHIAADSPDAAEELVEELV